jgi:hypothetical protein
MPDLPPKVNSNGELFPIQLFILGIRAYLDCDDPGLPATAIKDIGSNSDRVLVGAFSHPTGSPDRLDSHERNCRRTN